MQNNDDKNFVEKHVSTQEIFDGKILKISVDTVNLPNGKTATREIVKHPGAVAIVPILPDGKIVFVRQYRYPIKRMLYELPAGKLDAGESPENCAKRELQEETGYVANSMQKLTSIFTAPGFCDEVIHIFKATHLTQEEQQPDEDEFVEFCSFSTKEITQMIVDGTICDAKTLAGLFLLGIINE